MHDLSNSVSQSTCNNHSQRRTLDPLTRDKLGRLGIKAEGLELEIRHIKFLIRLRLTHKLRLMLRLRRHRGLDAVVPASNEGRRGDGNGARAKASDSGPLDSGLVRDASAVDDRLRHESGRIRILYFVRTRKINIDELFDDKNGRKVTIPATSSQ